MLGRGSQPASGTRAHEMTLSRSDPQVKTDVEELSPTRVKLTIEVPFEELKPSLDQAYREVARQVRVPGFRPGKVPPRIIDARIGRGVVLEQAVNDAVPQLYTKAVTENDVVPLGQPEVEITKLDDGREFEFTAEVDVRPQFELPSLDTVSVTVDNAEVSPDQVEEYLTGLRERFASLKTVERPVETGDYVSIDLAASVGGKPVEDAQAAGVSYEVGSESMLDGLDEALAGMSAGESKTFSAELAGGQHAGQDAEVLVTVNAVKVKELPNLDDEFAQAASEFDTVGELRAATRKQLEAMRKVGQGGQARDRVLDALLEQVDMPLPERIVEQEIEGRRENLKNQLERAGLTMKSYLESRDQTAAQLSTELENDARRSLKAQFILDKLAADEELKVTPEELSAYVAEQAYRMGVAPDRLAQQLSDNGQLGAVAGDVLRTNALTALAERARIVDEAGRPVYITAESGDAEADGDAEAERGAETTAGDDGASGADEDEAED
jgi:trigger factor